LKTLFLRAEKEEKMELLKVFLLTLGILSIAMVGLAITMLIKKGGKFPNTHVSGNKYLKRNGVYCSQTQDRLEQLNSKKKIAFKNVTFVPDKSAH
jgi:hypothetical protein